LRDPVAVLRGESAGSAVGQFWSYAGRTDPTSLNPDSVAAYSDLMASSQSLIAAHILAAHDMRRHRCLLDVGGGDGSFLIAAASASPNLQVMLYDLPPVAERARARFAAVGILGRSKIIGGDFHFGALPPGADIISLIRVIHDHDDNEALAILRAAYDSLTTGGTVLLAEPMAGIKSAQRATAYFTFYLLAMGSGHPRQPAALARMLRGVGFQRIRLLPAQQPLLVQAMVATKVDT
jgi:demethylspheroidene O-methyltransferase